jgi:hypothetical protein
VGFLCDEIVAFGLLSADAPEAIKAHVSNTKDFLKKPKAQKTKTISCHDN